MSHHQLNILPRTKFTFPSHLNKKHYLPCLIAIAIFIILFEICIICSEKNTNETDFVAGGGELTVSGNSILIKVLNSRHSLELPSFSTT